MSAFGDEGEAAFNRPAAAIMQAIPAVAASLGWRITRIDERPWSVHLVSGWFHRADAIEVNVDALTASSSTVHVHSSPRLGPLFAWFPDLGHHKANISRLLEALKKHLASTAQLTEVLEPPDPRWET